MPKRAVILVRLSSSKQAIESDSFEQQLRQCLTYIVAQGWSFVEPPFKLIETGAVTEERKFFREVIDFCKDRKNKIDYCVFRDISRFTREGSEEYLGYKKELAESGVKLQDIRGTIQDDINLLADRGFKYPWSISSPSQNEEIAQANKFKAERQDMLLRTIGSEINYVNMGYAVRQPPYGFRNIKILTTEHGKRVVLEEIPEESFFVKKAFELRARGHQLQEIADTLNNLGFKSRSRQKRDRRTQQPLGEIGGKPICAQRVSVMLSQLEYVGVIRQKWTHFNPIKAQFSGFIELETFNKVNEGKLEVTINDNAVTLKGEAELQQPQKKRRTRNNALYPFKNVILCPKCGHSLKGSAPKGGGGQRYPQYHCHQGHKSWYEHEADFNEAVKNFLKEVKFEEGLEKLEQAMLHEEYDKKRGDVIDESVKAAEHLTNLKVEQRNILEQIKKTRVDSVRSALEDDFDKLQKDIDKAEESRNTTEKRELNVKLGFKYGRHLIEHMEELLIDTDNLLRQEQLFGMLFKELPTYDEIVNRTVKLEPVFRLKSQSNNAQNHISDPCESRTRLTSVTGRYLKPIDQGAKLIFTF